ncbi:chaperone protein dnaJ-related [Striga hermonthica]|uniref:Chaperone protein dnaJ-related n=1 Tax=Striga hermonthica TaxID=68872 RepID=A0A9N7NRI5_STRHE|nr:chaperone protein dnaJ-related [Striga hermonthica]
MEQPFLSSGKSDGERWSSYERVGRAGSAIPTASLTGNEVTVDEIRSAAAYSGPYPPSLHAPLLVSPGPSPHNVTFFFSFFPGTKIFGYIYRQVLDEVEIRELLIDHVGHRCCWGSRPARTWNIHAVENCNVYVGTLETFVEERETITETEPYLSGEVDGTEKGPQLGTWEMDMRTEFPVLFTPHKESRVVVPHSEAIDKCSCCGGRGKIVCPTCNEDQEPGFYKANQMSQCSVCYGRGLIAHQDGSDTICKTCKGKGVVPCATCGSQGVVKCKTCIGSGSILKRQVALVKWRTFTTRKVSATSGAASVPDEVFHRAKGVQLCNTQAHQCTPAFFADSYFLNKFSSEVIAERAPVPSSARVICERHVISVIPVARVTMTRQRRSFSFYIIGTGKEVYMKDSYPSRFCWGLCPCLDWLSV